MTDKNSTKDVDHYGAQYGSFETDLLAEVRGEAFGEDIGQNGWLTAAEQDLFIEWLELGEDSHLLDIACGSGQPTLRIASKTGCSVTGLDLHEDAVAAARNVAEQRGMSDRAKFQTGNAAETLPFDDDHFDAITCVDSINHLPDRERVLREWRRVLKPGGKLLFVDPIVVTGAITNQEIAIRASIGFFLFVPQGLDEALLEEVGFTVIRSEDRTQNMADNARGWLQARGKREAELRNIEGDETFDGQQTFFETAAILAEERRLSRFAILSVKEQ